MSGRSGRTRDLGDLGGPGGPGGSEDPGGLEDPGGCEVCGFTKDFLIMFSKSVPLISNSRALLAC